MNSHVAQLSFNKIMSVANKYERMSYGCKNFTKVYIEADETAGLIKFDEIFLTVYAGSENLCNRIPFSYLAERWQQQAGTGIISSGTQTDELIFAVDFGCHYLRNGAELYVSIDAPDLVAGQTVEMTVHAETNSMESPDPMMLAYYTDSAFLIEGVETLSVHGANLDESSLTVNYQVGNESINQYVSGMSAVANCETIGDAKVTTLGWVYDGLPRDLQVNAPNADNVLTFIGDKKVPVKQSAIRRARRFYSSKFASFTSKETKLLENRG